MAERIQGGCTQCARKKRRCDRKRPRCSLCVRHGNECELQTFRNWTIRQSSRKDFAAHARPVSSRTTRSMTAVSFPSLSPTLPQPSPLPAVPDYVPALAGVAQGLSNNPGSTSSVDIPVQVQSGPTSNLRSFAGFPAPIDHAVFQENPAFDNLPDDLFVSEWSMTAPALEHAMEMTSGDDGHSPESPPATELGTVPDTYLRADKTSSTSHCLSTNPMPMTYCPMPWPSDMLQSPQRRFLWHCFIQTTSAQFMCLDQDDVRRIPDFQDPFASNLPTMALANEPLRAAVYCVAAAQHPSSIGRQMHSSLARRASSTVSQASEHLLLAAPDQDDFTVAATIVGGMFLTLTGHDLDRYHLRSATKLAAQFLQKSRSWSRLSVPYIQVTLALLRWSTISTMCSLQPDQDPSTENLYSTVDICQDELCHNFSPSFRRWTVHPLYAFSQNLVNPLLQMAKYFGAQQSACDWTTQPTSQCDDQDDNLERALADAYQKDLISLLTTAEDPVGFRCLNESMHAAASILFYARVKRLPFTSPLIRQQVQIVLDEIGKLEATSRIKDATLFPLFVSGCEAVDEEARVRILEEIRALESTFTIPEDRVSALQSVWQIRDSEPGLLWPRWTWKMDSQRRLGVLF